MTALWARLPLWLLFDGGVRALPPAAQLALVHVAAADGFTRCGPDACGALDALVPGAGASLAAMIERGIVEHRAGVLRLVPPSAPIADAPPPDGAEERDDAAPPTAAPPGVRPSQTPDAQRRRKVLAWFNHRAGPCRDVPKSTTWEAWSASPAGVALLAVGRPRQRGNASAGTRERGVPAHGNTPRNTAGTPQEHPRNTPPSDSPPSEETRQNEEDAEGNAGTRERGNALGNTGSGTRAGGVPVVPEKDPRGGAVGGFTLSCAEEVLHTIRSRSDGRFSTRYAHGQLQRFHALCADLMVNGGATRAEIERIGDHIRHGGLDWSKRPDVGALIAEAKDQRGPQLPRILTDMDSCADCGGKPQPSDDANDPWVIAAAKQGIKL